MNSALLMPAALQLDGGRRRLRMSLFKMPKLQVPPRIMADCIEPKETVLELHTIEPPLGVPMNAQKLPGRPCRFWAGRSCRW